MAVESTMLFIALLSPTLELHVVETGAQPTDTVRNILKREGVYMMKHLRGGVKKGAFDEATLQQKFDAWKENKLKGFEAIREGEAKAKAAAVKAELEAEKKMNEAIAKKVAEKKAAAEAAQANEAAAEATETTAEATEAAAKTTEEAPAAEAPATEATAEA